MSYEELERKELIERIITETKQVEEQLRQALKDLATAQANMHIDEEWAYTISYQAMLRAGRALMASEGFRPKGKEQHKTVVQFVSEILGEDYKALITQFDHMRRKRHDFIYEPDRHITKYEAKNALENAQKLVNGLVEFIQSRNSQIRLL